MYDEILSYNFFVSDMMDNQRELCNYVNECCLIAESTNTAENVALLEGSIGDKAKSIFEKIKAFIMKIWNKFVEVTANLIKSDKGYLEKYKDIILNKKPVECNYTMFNYSKGIPILVGTTIPSFDFKGMKDQLAQPDNFINTNFKNLISASGQKDNYYENFSDMAKNAFRGGPNEITVSSQNINMHDLYNYCYTYNNMSENIQKDVNTVNTAENNALNTINNIAQNSDNGSGDQGGTGSGDQDVNASFDMLATKPKGYYSKVYESYILENEDDKNNNQSGNNNKNNNQSGNNNQNNNQTASGNGAIRGTAGGSNGGVDNQSNPSKAYRTFTPDQQKDNLKNPQIAAADVGKQADEAIKLTKTYYKICGDLIAAKQTCAQDCYKTYMSIIKAHVRDYTNKGMKNDADNKATQTATNYNNTNNQQAQQQGQDQRQSK